MKIIFSFFFKENYKIEHKNHLIRRLLVERENEPLKLHKQKKKGKKTEIRKMPLDQGATDTKKFN